MILPRSLPQGRCRPVQLPVHFSRPALWRVLVVLMVAGCSHAPEVPAPPRPSPTVSSVLGVAVIEPVSDVADLTQAVRHVVAPDGTLAAASPSLPGTAAEPAALPPDGRDAPAQRGLAQGAQSAPVTAEPPVEQLTPHAPPVHATIAPAEDGVAGAGDEDGAPVLVVDGDAALEPALEPGTALQDEILAAWERYCVTTDLTPEEWGIIDRTAMPSVLQDRWAAQCRPEK